MISRLAWRARPLVELWRIERAWADGSAKRWLWLGGLVVALAVAATAVWQIRRMERDAARLREVVARLQAQSVVPASAAPVADFTAALRRATPMAVAAALRQACASAEVALVSVQMDEAAPGPDKLGRVSVNATLRGSYAASKLVLKQVLERFDGATLSQLRMRRGTQPGVIDTTLVLTVWSAPVPGGDPLPMPVGVQERRE